MIASTVHLVERRPARQRRPERAAAAVDYMAAIRPALA